jgi:copper chaperone NosL
MAEARRKAPALLIGGLVAAALAGTFVLAQRAPRGPVSVAWDQVACARCRMLVSDPRFAAQLHTRSDDVLFFDDPGCLLLWDHEHPQRARAVYFHHLDEERWVEGDAAVFVPASPTPMGYGLGVREKPAPGLDREAALHAALERDAIRVPGDAAAPPPEETDAHRP